MLPPSDSDEDEEDVKKPAPAKKEAGQVLSMIVGKINSALFLLSLDCFSATPQPATAGMLPPSDSEEDDSSEEEESEEEAPAPKKVLKPAVVSAKPCAPCATLSS